MLSWADSASSEAFEAFLRAIAHYWYIIGPVIGLACVASGYRQAIRRRQIQALPTSKVKGVFIDFVELKGVLECDAPIRSYLAEEKCAYYRYSILQQWRRTVTTTDSKGNTTTRTETGWTEVGSGEDMTCFDLVDDTGRIQVWPQSAECEAAEVLSVVCGVLDPLYYGKGPAMSIANSTHTRRFVEWILPLGHRLYLIGQSRERQDRVEPEIAHDPNAPRFLISVRDESEIVRGHI